MTVIETRAVLADEGYEGNRILAFIRSGGTEEFIPPKANRKAHWEYDLELYRERNLIGRAFNKLKHWRWIAIRYDLGTTSPLTKNATPRRPVKGGEHHRPGDLVLAPAHIPHLRRPDGPKSPRP